MEELRLIEEMTKEELLQIEKEIAKGTCKVGISAKEMYNDMVARGILVEKARDILVEEKDFLDEINKNTELILEELEKDKEKNLKSLVEKSPILNLHKHMTSWAIYRAGVVPVSGNQFAYLNPSLWGGLTYLPRPGAYANTYEFKSNQYGYVQIWAPRDADSCYYPDLFVASSPNPNDIPDGTYWGKRWCQKGYERH